MQRSIAKKSIEKLKCDVKKYPNSTKKKKSKGKKRNKWKANNKMVNLNSAISVIILNINGLNTPIKS